MKRRDFLNSSTVAAAGLFAAPYIAKGKPILNFKPNDSILADNNDNILILIELFGGNDGLNTIVPISEEDKYRELRDLLYIPAEETIRFEQSDLYLNKALVDNVHNGGMLQLMAEGRLAVVQGIGYENPTLSHFRSRDIWHAGLINTDPNEKLLEGWLGRFFSDILPDYPEVIPQHPLAIHIGGTIPLAFKSTKGHMGIALTDPDNFYKLGEGLTPIDPKFQNPGDDFYKREYNFAHIIGEQAEQYSKSVKEAYDIGKEKIKVDYSEGLPQQFKLISALIAGGLETKVYHVNLSNFDSHAQQMDSGYTGAHATLLNNLARAVSEFLDDAVQQGFHKRVAGLTFSEFGRRARDNGSRGSDHGAASMQFVFSGHDENINGGFFNNDGQPVFAKLNAADNIDYTYDFRRTYADALEQWLGAREDESENVFGEKVPKLEVLRRRVSSVEENLVYDNGKFINIYPNPNFGVGKISFTLKNAGNVIIELYEVTGKLQNVIHSGYLMNGSYTFDFNLNTSGNYFVNLKTRNKNYSEKIIVLK